MFPNKDITVKVMSSERTRMSFPGQGTIRDFVQFGVSFVESEDHFVTYVLAHPNVMKNLLCEFQDSILDPDGEILGKLWTADLISTKKLKENQMIFSNQEMSVVLLLDIPYQDGRMNAFGL
jgi:hypothetical protein